MCITLRYNWHNNCFRITDIIIWKIQMHAILCFRGTGAPQVFYLKGHVHILQFPNLWFIYLPLQMYRCTGAHKVWWGKKPCIFIDLHQWPSTSNMTIQILLHVLREQENQRSSREFFTYNWTTLSKKRRTASCCLSAVSLWNWRYYGRWVIAIAIIKNSARFTALHHVFSINQYDLLQWYNQHHSYYDAW